METQKYVNNTTDPTKMTILISPPSVKNSYYKKYFNQIIQFYKYFIKAILNKDNIIVLLDYETFNNYFNEFPKEIFIFIETEDIWLRDFGLVNPKNPIAFTYNPKYLKKNEGKIIQKPILDLFDKIQLKYKKSEIILDGGNYVDNNYDSVIISEKILQDNNIKDKDVDKFIDKLSKLIEIDNIAIIPMDEETLGHSDGQVMFVDKNLIIASDYKKSFPEIRDEFLKELAKELPGKKIIEHALDFDDSVFDGKFNSAKGIFVNCIVTNNFIYMPCFDNEEKNLEFEKLLKDSTKKEVIKINCINVCKMGGNVRCLSMQLEGKNANLLIEEARKSEK